MAVQESSNFLMNEENLPIRYDVYEGDPTGNKGIPIILFVHGFKGAKDWGPFPDAMRRIAKSGYVCIAMNLSHCGTDGNADYFDRLDLFSTQTLGRDHADIELMVHEITGRHIRGSKPWDTSQIGIIGHSKGGHSAVVAAARLKEIRCLVTWAAVADYLQHWNSDLVEDWRKQSMTFVENARTKQIMPLAKDIYEEGIRNKQLLMANLQASKLNIPSLFIHGTNDESVPSYNAETLYEKCSSFDKHLHWVEGANHTFGQMHPHTGAFSDDFDQVLNKTIAWFDEHLLP